MFLAENYINFYLSEYMKIDKGNFLVYFINEYKYSISFFQIDSSIVSKTIGISSNLSSFIKSSKNSSPSSPFPILSCVWKQPVGEWIKAVEARKHTDLCSGEV